MSVMSSALDRLVKTLGRPATARRQAMKEAMPQATLSAEHTRDCRVLPDRHILLDLMPKGAVCAEVGVAFGDYSAEIIARTTPSKLYLVDAWGSARYEDGLRQVEERLKGPLSAGQVEIRRGFSTVVLAALPDDHLDWVYIDTNHSFETTMAELTLCDRKVKADGLVAGHDFCTGNVVAPVPYGVIEACNQFCVAFGWQYKYLTLESHGYFSFCLSRR